MCTVLYYDYVIILSLITVDQSQTSIFHMFQYHYLGPDDWVNAVCKYTKFQDGAQTIYLCIGSQILNVLSVGVQSFVPLRAI